MNEAKWIDHKDKIVEGHVKYWFCSLPNNVLMVGRFGFEVFFFNSAVAPSTKSFLSN
jgi:hypothetical protein